MASGAPLSTRLGPRQWMAIDAAVAVAWLAVLVGLAVSWHPRHSAEERTLALLLLAPLAPLPLPLPVRRRWPVPSPRRSWPPGGIRKRWPAGPDGHSANIANNTIPQLAPARRRDRPVAKRMNQGGRLIRTGAT